MRHIKPLLALFLVLLVLFQPVAAAAYTMTGTILTTTDVKKDEWTNVQSLTYDATGEGHAITLIHFKVYRGSYVNFTIYYGSSSSVTGSAQSYISEGLPLINYGWTTSTINFNSDSSTYTYFDTNPEFDYNLAGYAKDDTNQTGFIVYHAGYGSFDDELAVFMPVSNLPSNLISKIEITGSQPFDIDITHGEYTAVASAASKGAIETALEWLNLIVQIGTFVYDIVYTTFIWFKFFFIDNIVMIVALYLTGTLAFAARNGRGRPDKILRSWFRDQAALYNFMFKIIEWIVTIINMVRRTIL